MSILPFAHLAKCIRMESTDDCYLIADLVFRSSSLHMKKVIFITDLGEQIV